LLTTSFVQRWQGSHKGHMASASELIERLTKQNPEEAEDLQEALLILQKQRLTTRDRLASLTESQWQRLGLPLGIEAIIRSEVADPRLESAPSPQTVRSYEICVSPHMSVSSMESAAGPMLAQSPSRMRAATSVADRETTSATEVAAGAALTAQQSAEVAAATVAMRSGKRAPRSAWSVWAAAAAAVGPPAVSVAPPKETAPVVGDQLKAFMISPLGPIRASEPVPETIPISTPTSTVDSPLPSKVGLLLDAWEAAPLLIAFVRQLLPLLHGHEGPCTPQELATWASLRDGPVALVLRTCAAMGLIGFDDGTGGYLLAEGGLNGEQPSLLAELERVLGTKSEAAEALLALYAEAPPPFGLASSESALYLFAWSHHRRAWRHLSEASGVSGAGSSIASLLDAVVILPLLVSVAHSLLREANVTLDLSNLDIVEQAVVEEILDDEFKLGSMDATGVFTLSAEGAQTLERSCRPLFWPVSRASALGRFESLLRGSDSDALAALDTTTVVQASLDDAVHDHESEGLEEEVLRSVCSAFENADFDRQPSCVAVLGCGNDGLLLKIWQRLKVATGRGRVLSKRPLIMAGVAPNEEAAVRSRRALAAAGAPAPVVVTQKVHGRLEHALRALQRRGVCLEGTLCVLCDRACRRTIAPATKIEGSDEDASSALVAFSKAHMGHLVGLDGSGRRLPSSRIVFSLMGSYGELAEVLRSTGVSHGVCIAEQLPLGLPATRLAFDCGASPVLDIVTSLMSRHLRAPAAVHALAAASAGLLPEDLGRGVCIHPYHARFCRGLAQRLVQKPFQIRLAELRDLPRLCELEALARPVALQVPEQVLRARLNASPEMNLVCTAGGEVIAALYMQRIDDDSALDGWTCKSTAAVHSSNGKLLHLISLVKDPAFNDAPIGSELRGFALHVARLDVTLEAVVVVAVPRRDRCGGKVAGESSEDPFVTFHTAFGARVIRTLSGSVGCGGRVDGDEGEEEEEEEEPEEHAPPALLLRYELRSPSAHLGRRCGPTSSDSDSTMGSGGGAADCGSLAEGVDIKRLLAEVFEGFGFNVGDADSYAEHANFFECSTIGSAEALQIRDKLCVDLDMDLPATLLYDYPSILALSDYLCARTTALERQQEDADDDGGTSTSASDSEEEEGEVEEKDEEEKIEVKWDRLSSRVVVRIQSECVLALKEPSLQDKFKAVAKRCFPDKFKYSQAIASICDEVQAKVLYKFGLIRDVGGSSIQTGSNRLHQQVCKYWLVEPKLKEVANQLTQVTWTGQEWPA